VYFSGQDLTVRALAIDGRLADAATLAEALTSLLGSWRSYLLQGYALTLSGKEREASAAFARAKALYKPPPPSTKKFKQVDEDGCKRTSSRRARWRADNARRPSRSRGC